MSNAAKIWVPEEHDLNSDLDNPLSILVFRSDRSSFYEAHHRDSGEYGADLTFGIHIDQSHKHRLQTGSDTCYLQTLLSLWDESVVKLRVNVSEAYMLSNIIKMKTYKCVDDVAAAAVNLEDPVAFGALCRQLVSAATAETGSFNSVFRAASAFGIIPEGILIEPKRKEGKVEKLSDLMHLVCLALENAGEELASMAKLSTVNTGSTRAAGPTDAEKEDMKATVVAAKKKIDDELVLFFGSAPAKFKVDGKEHDAASFRDLVYKNIGKDDMRLMGLDMAQVEVEKPATNGGLGVVSLADERLFAAAVQEELVAKRRPVAVSYDDTDDPRWTDKSGCRTMGGMDMLEEKSFPTSLSFLSKGRTRKQNAELYRIDRSPNHASLASRFTLAPDGGVACIGLKDWRLRTPYRKWDLHSLKQFACQAIVSDGAIQAARARIAKEDEKKKAAAAAAAKEATEAAERKEEEDKKKDVAGKEKEVDDDKEKVGKPGKAEKRAADGKASPPKKMKPTASPEK